MHANLLEEIQVLREVYRLCRATFYANTGGDHESVRVRIDDLYFEVLALLIKRAMDGLSEDEIVAEMDQPSNLASPHAASDDDSGVTPVIRFRLTRQRMPAAVMARSLQLSDMTILQRIGLADRPDSRERSPVLRVTRMCRAVAPGCTLAWMQTLNMLLYPDIYPAKPDRISASKLANELSCFVDCSGFFEQVGLSLDTVDLRVSQSEPIMKLLGELLDREDATAYSEDHAERIENTVVPAFLAILLGSLSQRAIQAKSPTRLDLSWYVPVIYQGVARRMSSLEFVRSHHLDPSQNTDLIEFYEAISS